MIDFITNILHTAILFEFNNRGMRLLLCSGERNIVTLDAPNLRFTTQDKARDYKKSVKLYFNASIVERF